MRRPTTRRSGPGNFLFAGLLALLAALAFPMVIPSMLADARMDDRAVAGEGEPGVLVVESHRCGTRRGQCAGIGTFTSDAGVVYQRASWQGDRVDVGTAVEGRLLQREWSAQDAVYPLDFDGRRPSYRVRAVIAGLMGAVMAGPGVYCLVKAARLRRERRMSG